MRRKLYLLLSLLSGVALMVSVVLFLRTTSAMASALPEQTQVVENGLAYLQTQQGADGGIVGFSRTSDSDTTVRSVMAFVLAGKAVTEVSSTAGNLMLDFLAGQVISFTHDVTGTLFPGRAGLLLSAVSLGGDDPTNFGGMDLVGELEASFQPETGAYSTTAKQDFSSGQASDINQAWSLLGLSLAKGNIPDEAIQYLIQSQAADGSWGFGDPDTTALAATALLTSKKVSSQDQMIQNALQFFHDTQLPNGGWKPSWDTDPLNADSTGWIIQAIVSAGEDPSGDRWKVEQTDPVQALMGMQKADGSIGGTYANPYSTAEAIIGLSGIPVANVIYPIVSHQAGLAVFTDEGSVITACIRFEEDSVTGLDLLQRSGLSIQTATNPSQGTAVCEIEGVGCSSKDCFCSMPDYWSYWQGNDQGWAYSALGSEQIQVADGDVNAWSWGTGNPPAELTYQNICEGVPFVIPTATATTLPATDTPIPSPVPPSIEAPTTTPTTTPGETPGGPGTYVVYGSIIVVLGLLILYLYQSRRKR